MCTEVAEVRPAEQALAHFACACEENRARAVAQCFRVWCQLAAEEQRELQLTDQAQTLRHLLFGRRAVTHWRAATRKALTVYTRVITSGAACVGEAFGCLVQYVVRRQTSRSRKTHAARHLIKWRCGRASVAFKSGLSRMCRAHLWLGTRKGGPRGSATHVSLQSQPVHGISTLHSKPGCVPVRSSCF